MAETMTLASWLQRVQALCDAATKGPILERGDDDYYQGGIYLGTGPYHYENGKIVPGEKPNDMYFHNDICRIHGSDDDKKFIQQSFVDLPTALKLIAYLQARVFECQEHEVITVSKIWLARLANELETIKQNEESEQLGILSAEEMIGQATEPNQ